MTESKERKEKKTTTVVPRNDINTPDSPGEAEMQERKNVLGDPPVNPSSRGKTGLSAP